jgi:uncharacterized membrane protein HdeD (DUF308 family)
MAETKGLGLRGKLHQSWGWLLALGVVLILFGFLILTTPMGVVTASLTTEMWIALALVAAGVLQLMHGIRASDWSHSTLQLAPQFRLSRQAHQHGDNKAG